MHHTSITDNPVQQITKGHRVFRHSNRTVFNFVSNVLSRLPGCCLLCSVSTTIQPLSQQMISQTKTNPASPARFFPARLAPATCICSELYLVYFLFVFIMINRITYRYTLGLVLRAFCSITSQRNFYNHSMIKTTYPWPLRRKVLTNLFIRHHMKFSWYSVRSLNFFPSF